MTDFTQLGLGAPILKALAAEGYTTPTPIQLRAIPDILAGRDLVGIAQTGTGKTAAFALPILERLASDRRPVPRRACRVLVLSPTRELASQIRESFVVYGRHLRLSSAVVFGGVSGYAQERALSRGVDILVATPGRLLDHLQTGALDLGAVEVAVLDEADRMLDMGFIEPVRRIARAFPKNRQTLLFSASMPQAIRDLARDFLNRPVEVAVTPVASTAERIDQRVVFAEPGDKRRVLAAFLVRPEVERALVFTRTKHGADKLVKQLLPAGIEAAAIHGNKSQGQRERALAAFRAGDARVLVATDIAARGIDVDGISHVFNFDLPNVPESYVHRIGRTARAGASGVAISLCSGEERPWLRDIEKLIRQRIPVMEPNIAGSEAPTPRQPIAEPSAAPRLTEGRPVEARPADARRHRPRRRPPAGIASRHGDPAARDHRPAGSRQARA